MTHTERLNKMSVRALKKEIVAHNSLLRGYSRLKKADIIALIIKNKHLFKHLFPSTSSTKSTNTTSTSTAPPPTPATAKKALKKAQAKTNPLVTELIKAKQKRTRIYRFRVNGKEFKKKNNTWARIIEVEGSFPIKQQPSLWTAEANVMFGKLKRTGQLKFKHNIKAHLGAPAPAPASPNLMML